MPCPSSQDSGSSNILDAARPFLRGELHLVDPKLPSLISVLRSVGAGECWHKHGSFLDHLVDIYKILKLWNCPDPVCLWPLPLGLLQFLRQPRHFRPSTSRHTVCNHVGNAAERLIHLFCIVPRQSLIHDDLLFNYTDQQLVHHLKLSQASLTNAKDSGVFDHDEEWRRKIRSLLPAEGIVVKHIKTGEDVGLSRRVVAVFLMMTMADFSDQLFSFQDVLFENDNGRLEFSGNNVAAGLWPGDGKPGLWMNSISRMGALYSLIVREEELYMAEKHKTNTTNGTNGTNGSGTTTTLNGTESATVDGDERDERIELPIPPVFNHCTKVLDTEGQRVARDLYWEAALCGSGGNGGVERAEELLVKCVEKNPFIGEPHVVLAQIHLSKGSFEEAEREGEKGLRLLLEWGSPWDKRMSWEGWVAWARVLVMKAKERSWPQNAWGVLNLGLVK
ncbi:hypothetical protein Sjap_014436 [Stephania japonica]|uniref:DUF6817 domain-containing protein n=1 Tax=Stephania japonica TaxID=461633 RepID=A0AAP0IH79_9MAGN